MADQNANPNHRSLRLKVPPRAASVAASTTFVATPPTSRTYPQPYFPFPAATPTASATPSKHRLSGSSLSSRKSKTSLSFLFLLLFSLRSLYSLLPFLRSAPSFSLFPFSFLVSLLSFLLTYGFSVFTSFSSYSSKDPFHQKQTQKIFSLTSISQSELRVLLARSILLAVVFLLRFQALRYCGTAAMILAELSGNVTARFVTEGRDRNFIGDRYGFLTAKVRGFIALALGLLLLSVSWDRVECFPLSSTSVGKLGFLVIPRETCLRIWPMLLPFLSGFLGCYERVSMNWGTMKQLGKKRIRLISLFFTTLVLFFPAVITMIMFESKVGNFSLGNLVWPLANTVVFGVLLAENFSDEKSVLSSKDFQREFLVTFACTLVLELFYFRELSLWGLLICGCLLYIAARELDSFCSSHVELGTELSQPLSDMIMKPIRHILSERKSRKIALFLMINAGYMVVEFVAGFMSNSLGLISDACHMLFDCAALAIGLYASYISRFPANSQFNYGRGRFEVLSGYVNAVFLVLVGSLIVLESLERILDPQEISTNSLLTVSIGGLLVNVIGLIFFHEEHHHAHGGSGSCSHSHSHDQKYSQEKHISVSHETHHDHHHHDDHGHSCQHDHGNKAHSHDNASHQIHHHHDNHDHGNHPHSHGHDDSHQIHDHHDNHDHSCQHDHMNQPHSHDHASHQIHHRHGHHHHNHDSHDHSCQHDHVQKPHSDDHSQGKEESKTHQQHHHHHIDHNMEGIFLHVLADTLGSVGVVISTLVIKYKGWLAADPICSIFISILIVSSVIPLLRNSAEVLLQRVPRAHERDLRKALIQIRKMKGVRGIQNLHVWSFTNTDIVGTFRLHVDSESDKSSLKKTVSDMLREAGVKDLTLQVQCVR